MSTAQKKTSIHLHHTLFWCGFAMPPRLACSVPPAPCCCCPVMVTFLWTPWMSGVVGQVPCCCTGLPVASGIFPLWKQDDVGKHYFNNSTMMTAFIMCVRWLVCRHNKLLLKICIRAKYHVSGQQGEMQGRSYKANWNCGSIGVRFLSHRLWGKKINPTRWWSHYQIKSQLNSVDMRGGIEGRLFPDSSERCDRSIQEKKRGDISDLSPVESKWINPSYRNHSSWLHPSNAKLHYTGTTAARCVLHPPHTPLLLSFCVLRCFVLCLMKI